MESNFTIEQLNVRREVFLRSLVEIENYLENIQDQSMSSQLTVNLITKLDRLERYYNEFERVQTEIEFRTELINLNSELNTREDTNRRYDAILSLARPRIDLMKSQERLEHSKSQIYQNIKLPTIDLPSFDGNILQWRAFEDSFLSLIHENHMLSDVQKLHYLRSALKGEALALIKDLNTTATNYHVALELIKSRFSNIRTIVYSHVEAIINAKAHNLKSFINTIDQNVRCLKSLNIPVESWDAILIPMILAKLDSRLNREWDLHVNTVITKNSLPTYNNLIEYMLQRANTYTVTAKVHSAGSNHYNNHAYQKPYQKTFAVTSSNAKEQTPWYSCPVCNNNHSIYYCKAFLAKGIKERIELVRNLRLCMNCLKGNHFVRNCRAAPCNKCNDYHNVLLHIEAQKENRNPSNVENLETNNVRVNCCTDNPFLKEVLLPTVELLIYDKRGIGHKVRGLLDSASQSSLISTTLAKKLNLDLKEIDIAIKGIDRGQIPVKHQTKIKIASKYNKFSTTFDSLVIKQITEDLPQRTFEKSSVTLPDGIASQLADFNFNMSNKIDILIGGSTFWELLENDRKLIKEQGIILQKTKLGWVVSGKAPLFDYVYCNSALVDINKIENSIDKLWILDEFKQNNKLLTDQEAECEQMFIDNTVRDDIGRFVVKLPFKNSINLLGHSKEGAVKRFFNLERKLAKNVIVKEMYHDFLKEYEELGHMSACENFDDNDYYFPHHHVVREDSKTTKLRVVFDGSFKTSSGTSLNDILHIGPTLQNDLFAILISFRKFKFVVTADVEKMYRQIIIHSDDRKFQKIVWRSAPTEKLQIFKLNTVTYGTTCAPYLAIRCLNKLAEENEKDYPVEAKLIKENFYVDDLLVGADNIEVLESHCKNLSKILMSAQFKLHKWCSNINLSIANSSESTNKMIEINPTDSKTLGINYNSESDHFHYVFKENFIDSVLTKRKILSMTAQIFDPLGLLSPIIIVPKIIIQELWSLKLGWDDKIPQNINKKWEDFCQNLNAVNKISIPRHVISSTHISLELHGFSDASEKAYGACLYIKSIKSDGTNKIHLVTAKSRVAPLKTVSLARLELCAAVVLAELTDRVCNILKLSFTKKYYWSDSTITLAWIKGNCARWKTFVANRAAEIQNLSDVNDWHHINSKDNPADLISRGVNPKVLEDSTLWWQGPPWLSNNQVEINDHVVIKSTDIPEQKSQIINSCVSVGNFNIFSRYSSLSKLINVVAYIYRYYNKSTRKTIHVGSLSIVERADALMKLIRLAQLEAFSSEMTYLEKKKDIQSESKILSLNPFLDENGILRVGGRIKHSNLTFDQKHQIILPKDHQLTILLLNFYHQINLHCGALALLNAVRNVYWPINGKSLCRKVIHKCMTCYKARPRPYIQLMGDLPKERLVPSPPFYNSGVDYAGPIFTRDRRSRGFKKFKSYICLFVCFSTKAVHLELVTDLTSAAFIGALRRFVARRGKPNCIYSDNGTNFVAANKELTEIYEWHKKESSNINSALSNEGTSIDWKFIPARSPHFGGLWEASVKLVKFHLRRVLGENIFTFEELYTFLTQVEAIVNSRPLSPLSDDPNDLNPLTPGHFLIGRPLNAVLDESYVTTPENRLTAFEKMQKLTQEFWRRWSKEYIHTLQQRHKWMKSNNVPLKEGMLVLMVEENTPPTQWKLGRVVELHKGKDQRVRVVSVRTQNGVLKRSVCKICVLPMDN